MINFVVGLCLGATFVVFVQCFIDLPFYRAAKKHLALSKKMLDEQQELFQSLQRKPGICSCGPVRTKST
jgi:hypothetical protein